MSSALYSRLRTRYDVSVADNVTDIVADMNNC